MIGGNHAARAGHIIHDKRRITRNVLSHMARHCARINIEAAASRQADYDPNYLTLIVVLGTDKVRVPDDRNPSGV